jgi:hypothetical protein
MTMKQRVTIEYEQDILETNPDGRSTHTVAVARMRCEVEIDIDMSSIIYGMGARACQSKNGKCRDGYVTVKRIGKPSELSREANPWK